MDSRHALRYPRQATFHPLKYLAGVAEACAKRGVRYFAYTAADEIVEDGAVTVKCAQGLIRAGHAVVATNSSIVDRVALHSKTSPYRTYVIGFAINAAHCRMRSAGTLKSLITTCVFSRAKTAWTSS